MPRQSMLRLVTVAGPPSAGKTSLLLRMLGSFTGKSVRAGVVKFDCLNALDEERFQAQGIPVLAGIAGNLCPDHFYITNIESCFEWAQNLQLDWLLVESAGLCNRCSPHLRDHTAVCVVDCLSGIGTPFKIGPMLRLADHVILTKGDLVSQAEREVFRYRIQQVNSKARVSFANGITGQGCDHLLSQWSEHAPTNSLEGNHLRFTMPTAVCSYCLGEKRVGKDRQIGIVRKMEVEQCESKH